VDVDFAKHSDAIDAIVWMGYAGQAAGAALADVLVGNVNPSGRLTQTWYPRDFVNKVSPLSRLMALVDIFTLL
jgi:beta-D-xylosidase 4